VINPINLINVRIRPNTDDTNKDLVGWMECLDSNSGIFYNNIKIKLKKKEEGGIKVTLDFPAKNVIMSDKTEKKIFYVKPINATAYRAFELVAISAIKQELGRKNEK